MIDSRTGSSPASERRPLAYVVIPAGGPCRHRVDPWGLDPRAVAIAATPILLGAIFTVHGAAGFSSPIRNGGLGIPGVLDRCAGRAGLARRRRLRAQRPARH
jgi:hypothetical protein